MDDENVFESCEIVQLGDKRFAKSFISVAVRELEKVVMRGCVTVKQTIIQLTIFV